MKQYAVDLRERRLQAIDAGLPRAEATRLFGVSASTIARGRHQQRARGDLTPAPRPGRRLRIGPAHQAALVAHVRAQPDATLAEHGARWAQEQGGTLSKATMSRALRRAGWPLKKTVHASERNEPRRTAWWVAVGHWAPPRIVCLDETSTQTTRSCTHARAPRGARAVGRLPRNHGPNVSLLATLTPTGPGPAMVLPGAVDRGAFQRYVEDGLVPSLHPGQVVLLDNLSGPKATAARQAVEAAGGERLCLPPYSPDFTPIELAVAKLKTHFRGTGARTFDALVTAIGAGLDTITATDAHGFYAPCGFGIPSN